MADPFFKDLAFAALAQTARNPTGDFNRSVLGAQQLQRPADPYLRQQYPEVYGGLGGFMGMAPDEMAGSVLDPNTARVRAGAQIGFPIGTATQVVPALNLIRPAVKAGARALGPTAVSMGEGYLQRQGLMPNVVPENINIKESLYETAQEGPFFRVQPKTFAATGQKNRGIREEIQQPDIIGGTNRSNVPQPISDETVNQFVNTPNNFVRQIADEFTQRTSGQKYELPKMPPSSLAKQSAIGRTFQLASEGDELYKNTVFQEYGKKFPQLIESTGVKNYDQLLEAAYLQLAKETQDQFYSLPVSLSYHRTGEGSYSSSKEMLKDVYGNKHLYVYQGGDPHDFLNAVDPQTKLNTNEMFRAVHDFYGHAVHGNQFGAKGEEIAYGAHSQMFSPLARIAMASETRGQNSFVNYTPINAELKARINKLNGIRYEANRSGKLDDVIEIDKLLGETWQNFQFAPQKSVLLPPEFLDISFTGGMPNYIQPLIKPKLGTTISETLTHFSNRPDLTFLDPSRYGQGIKGREMERLLGTENPVMERSYAYIGDPSKVRAEPGLGAYKYGAESQGLYNLLSDPLAFRTLSIESGRTPFTSKYNQGIPNPSQAFTDVERMAKEYGYEGAVNPGQGTAILFGPTPVKKVLP